MEEKVGSISHDTSVDWKPILRCLEHILMPVYVKQSEKSRARNRPKSYRPGMVKYKKQEGTGNEEIREHCENGKSR